MNWFTQCLGAVSTSIILFQIYVYGSLSEWLDFMDYLIKTL